jgi:hypothetical protein
MWRWWSNKKEEFISHKYDAKENILKFALGMTLRGRDVEEHTDKVLPSYTKTSQIPKGWVY